MNAPVMKHSGTLTLNSREQDLLEGAEGEGSRLAMRIIVRLAAATGAERLIEIKSAHVDGCLYHGQASLDFAERLRAGQARVCVPTTLNSGSLDLIHPHLYRGDPETKRHAGRLMQAYVSLGCRPTWTCAPYQQLARPTMGDQIAWAESNAVVFANSVLGARTNRYGDFVDICAAICGRVPAVGLHCDENRVGTVVYSMHHLPRHLLLADVFYPVLGHLVGVDVGAGIPVLDGLPGSVSEDQLKVFGAAAASSGSVGLFHAVGITPEALTRDAALTGRDPHRVVDVTLEQLLRARDALTTARSNRLMAVSLGTPHFSIAEFAQLISLLPGVSTHPDVDFFVSTGRDILADVRERGWEALCAAAGITLLVDTCTYITPILRSRPGAAMTNSAKWAYYAPGNLGIDVVFGSMRECVESAARGEVWRDPELWDF